MPQLLLIALLILISCNNNSTINPDTLYKAKEAFDAQNYKQAMLQLDRILSQAPKHEEALLLKSRTFQQTGQPEAAIQTIGKAITANGKNHEALSFRAVMLANQGKYAEAQKDILAAINLDSNNPDYRIELGINQQLQGKYKEAVHSFNEVIKRYPENDNAYYLRGNARQKLGNKVRALKDYDMAIRLNPSVPEFFSKRGFLLMEQERYEDAIDDFTTIMALASEDNSDNKLAIAYNNRGYVRYKQKEFGSALNDINRSINLFPENSYAYRNRALVHFANHQIKDGCWDVKRGLALGFNEDYGTELKLLQREFCQNNR